MDSGSGENRSGTVSSNRRGSRAAMNPQCGVCERDSDGTLRWVQAWNANACARCREVGLYPTGRPELDG